MNATVQPRWFRRRRREAEERALTPQTSAPPAYFPASTTPAVTAGNALAISDVFACVRALSDAAASLPLIAYRKTTDGRTRASGRVTDLLRQPAPATTQANLVGTAMAHLQLHGNCYLAKFRNNEGRVEQLGLIHPDRVATSLVGGVPRYTIAGEGLIASSEHGAEDIIHVRGLSTDGLVGLSPIRQCRIALGLSQSLGEHASAFFENAARPSGLLRVSDEFLGQDQEERGEILGQLRADLTDIYAGPRNAHKIAILTGDMTWTPMSGPLDDMQFIQQRHLSTAEIARIFRVPPHVIGASSGDSMTYSNVEQQSLNFVTYSLRPWLVLIEQAISEDADLCPGALYVEFLLDALLRADSATRADVYTKALHPQTGWMTRDEIRKLENLEPEPPQPTAPGAVIA